MSEKIDPETYFQQGENKFNAGRFEAALKFYDKALNENPNLVKALFSRGKVNEKLKNFK